ncbi:uncharacterized protein LOC111317871 [Durio zibethinus]|uniref:Uncharacterized protein LOC111317871 n=1 Tax=Durio zibethinus TaxID=66656 RepID=A0A6P6BGA0_DURZI|nr:uncharacterized protein LOC111317871 [Durio zibethinus]
MFGRVRASPSLLDSLETPPSKIIKGDSLSIYEATLMKLKLGSYLQDISSDEEAMVVDTDCSSASVSNGSSDCQSTGNSQQRSEGVSILYLFSKFKAYQRTPTASHEAMMIENDGSASFSSSSECQPLSSAKEQGNQESSNGSSFPLFC